jgi:hypothetical protein
VVARPWGFESPLSHHPPVLPHDAVTTRTISIRVSDEVARAYEAASEDDRRKLDALLTIQLARARQPHRPLDAVMSEMSRKAQQRGLTPEVLDEILRGEI